MPYDGRLPLQQTIHAVITEYDGYFVASCHEVSAVTDGRTLDETVCNLKEAIALFLDGEDPAEFGLIPNPGITFIYHTGLPVAAA